MSEVKLKPSDYVHLHNHSQYSLLDGLTKVPALMQQVKKMGMKSVALTDHGTMSGAIEFYKAAVAEDIKPIIGIEAYVAPRLHTDKDPVKDRQPYHLTLLAMNHLGYLNLMQLSTIANLDGFYYRPRIDRELLHKYNEGLIVLSGCIGGEVGDALRKDNLNQALETAKWYKQTFGDRYYIELMDHGHAKHPTVWKEQQKVNKHLLKISKDLDIPAVVTCDAHYLMHEDQEAHEILLCVQTGSFLSEDNRFSLKDFDLHVIDPSEIIDRWGADHPELIKNTKKIAGRINLEIELGKILIPKFPTPPGETERSLLHKNVWRGLAWRYASQPRSKTDKMTIAEAKKFLNPEIIQRANFEIEVVDKMGFNGYFLIVADFINWGKDRGIVFGPGRGSAASSIMAYAIRITEIDPLKYDLLFERFLNPERISMPDMDIDIQDTRRDEVINYCVEKYGRERVANIVTFGRMAARNSVRDVARVLEVPYAEADRLAKMIPPPVQGRHTPLLMHLQNVAELKLENEENNSSSRVFDLATRLEGTIRSHGVHAAGVVIAPDDIVKFVPLEMAQKGVTATQYSMGPIEDLGLLKMDFLGLSNLTTIKNALRIISKVHGKDIDIGKIPLDDKKTFALLQRGQTTGVFQLESAGMKRYLKELKPTEFEDIIAMVALYRPGPMQWIEDFIARKQGRRKITYLHPAMQSTLESTYGVIVYQEQVMQISKEMCGFSGGQADTLRKAIGKKDPAVMKKLKNDFINGAIKTVGADKKLMDSFWQQLEDFAAYCFNKVHSACYALIAYQTAYLKANYPSAYMAALMTSDYDNIDRLAIEINECRQMGIEVLQPDVNQSFHEFAIVPSSNQIRFGLDAIKNVGHGAVEEIIVGREKAGGQFKDLEDFCKHVSYQVVNRKSMESLIRAGALDRFGERGQLYENLELIMLYATQVQKSAASNQVDLFGGSSGEAILTSKLKFNPVQKDYSMSEMLGWERELLGLYLSHNPLADYQDYLSKVATPLSEIVPGNDKANIQVGGSISAMREINTKNGAKMAFIQLTDMSGEIEVVVFPKTYQETIDIWQRDRVVLIKGRISSSSNNFNGAGELKILVDTAKVVTQQDLDKAPAIKPKKKVAIQPAELSVSANTLTQRLYIRLSDSNDQKLLMSLKEKLDDHRGQTEVVLVTGVSESKQIIKLPQTVNINEDSIRDLATIFGSTNIVVR